MADLGLYVTKGPGAGKLGEGAPGKCEGSQHQLWESTWLFPLPLRELCLFTWKAETVANRSRKVISIWMWQKKTRASEEEASHHRDAVTFACVSKGRTLVWE